MEAPLSAPEETKEEALGRFYSKVGKVPGGCWLWLASKNHKGYGIFWYRSRNAVAHRFAWEQSRGPIPPGLVIDHFVCENPSCVNPAHLRVTTNRANVIRGIGGERSPNAKLTESQVREIRARCAAGAVRADLAREFGVGDSTLGRIVRREKWTHVK